MSPTINVAIPHRPMFQAISSSQRFGRNRGAAVVSLWPSSTDQEPDMNDRSIPNPPAALQAILRDTAGLGFSMASELQTGSLLRTLAALKPAGRFLELGTGTGVATA